MEWDRARGLGWRTKRGLQGLLVVGVGDVIKVGEENRVEQAPLTNLGDVLVELGPAPTVIRPFGAGMTPHGQAVVGRSMYQELGKVKFLLLHFHVAVLRSKPRSGSPAGQVF